METEPSSLPSYPEMILAALDALNEEGGSNRSAISNYIESNHTDLPENHSQLLSDHLNKMKEDGEIVFFKNNYMRFDPEAPPKRGRGRPKKDPNAPPALKKTKTTAASFVLGAGTGRSGVGQGRTEMARVMKERKRRVGGQEGCYYSEAALLARAESEAIARKGIGKDHVKWSPAATVTFMYEPGIHINEDMMEALTLGEKRSWVESSPTRVFDIDPHTNEVVFVDEGIKKAEGMGKPGLN